MPEIMTTHEGAVSLPGVSVQTWDFEANETIQTQDFNVLNSQFQQSRQGAIQWSGSCRCSLAPAGALNVGPFAKLFDLAAASDDITSAPPNLFPVGYELVLAQAVRNYIAPPAATGPAVVASVGLKVSSTFRLLGFADPDSFPLDNTVWNKQRFNLKAWLTDSADITFDAIIQSLNARLVDGVVDVEISGRNSGDIVSSSTTLIDPASLGGAATFTFASGKTVSGDILFTEVSITRDASRCDVSLRWVNKGAMTVVWGEL